MKKSVVGICFLLIFVIIFFIAGDHFFFKREYLKPVNAYSDTSSTDKASPTNKDGTQSHRPDRIIGKSDNRNHRPDKDNLQINPIDREAMVSTYREKLSKIKNNLKEQGFDFAAMSEELRLRLKKSENGRLLPEDLLVLLPREVENDFREMMNLIMQLGEIDNIPKTTGEPGEEEI
ncbi:MAG: hypothetical protein KJ737_25230 [Proteobacteria bacterium]|nr:hypothetical protein [Pseudomonadota bacterium]